MNETDSASVISAHDCRLSAKGLSISRGGARIINGISLTLEPGETAILRGPNGAGKTTLLRAFAGLLRIDSGSIGIERQDGSAVDDPFRATIYCGPLNAVKAALSVDENLRFWAALYNAPGDLVSNARAAFRLDDYARQSAGTLSTGLGRRLGLARLLLARKPIWLVDEPTASLDVASAAIFTSLAERHCAVGGIAIIATHDAFSLSGARNIELKTGSAA